MTCRECAVWKHPLKSGEYGECWSSDGIGGEMKKLRRMTMASEKCEAFIWRAKPTSAFRHTRDRTLDRDYLRLCAVYRMLKHKRLGFAAACKLVKPNQRGTVELWRANSLKEMLP